MASLDLKIHPHRRYNPLLGEWLLISPHRALRPWNGSNESDEKGESISHDPNCYLCPKNTRANGSTNPDYQESFVFVNDFSALLKDTPTSNNFDNDDDDLFKVQGVNGECRVICFSPNHSKSLPLMNHNEILKIVQLWAEQYHQLSNYKYVQIFENKGAIQGCSNPHPHGQIWASDFIPQEIEKELKNQLEYFKKHNSNLLDDYLKRELAKKERVVYESDFWVVLVPFWAFWPFETIVLPKFKASTFAQLTNEHQNDLAKVIKVITTKYDNLFNCSFPYSMGWHVAPNDGKEHNYWTLHAHFYPPLLRNSKVKKFVAGFELLAEKQRDITPESAACLLKDLDSLHYSIKEKN